MNIFVVSNDVDVCAQALDDLRLRKMIVETAQMLSTAKHVLGSGSDRIYKSTHISHPCAKWVRRTYHNYQWTLGLLKALIKEYHHRFNKPHATEDILLELESNPATGLGFTEPANCSLYKNLPIHEAYQLTLVHKWNNDKQQPRWTNRGNPWFYK